MSLLWLILLSGLSCQERASEDDSSSLLPKMRKALGIPTFELVSNIYALAECSGPASTFETLVISSPANTRFEQKAEGHHILGVHRQDSAWIYDIIGDTSVAVDSATLTFLIDHELHAIAFYPESRFGSPVSEKDTVYYSEEAIMLTFKDIKEGPVNIFYRTKTWLPLGFSVQNHLGGGASQVDVLFANWQKTDGIRVFTEARFLQGADVYHYLFTKIRFGELPKEAFTKNQALILP